MVNQGTLTVPANKVWKITSASSYGRGALDGYTNYANGGLYIDNIETAAGVTPEILDA